MAATLPTLPQLTVDTTVPSVTGNSRTVGSGMDYGDLQTALNDAAGWNASQTHELVLTYGETFTGPFTLPARSGASGYILIRSSAGSGLPAAGYRATTSHLAAMPIIQSNTGNDNRCLNTSGRSDRYFFKNVYFPTHASSGYEEVGLVQLGTNSQGDSEVPRYLIFDQCIVRNTADVYIKNGIMANCDYFAFVNGSILNIWDPTYGNECHGINAYNSFGPYRIENNYITAMGQHVLIGAAQPTITQATCLSDWTIRRNYFYRETAWGNNSHYKHNFEGKAGVRILFERNIYDARQWEDEGIINMYISHFDGTPTGSDWTIRYNKFYNIERGFWLNGDFWNSLPTAFTRIHVHNNLCYLLQSWVTGSSGRACDIQHENAHVTVEHNTWDNAGASINFYSVGDTMGPFTHLNNIYRGGNSSDCYLLDTAYAEGTASLDAYWGAGNWQSRKNFYMGKLSMSGFPATDSNPSIAQVAFQDYANHDYRLTPSSVGYQAAVDVDGNPTGLDVGCDVATLNTYLAGVVDGDAEGGGGGPSVISVYLPPDAKIQYSDSLARYISYPPVAPRSILGFRVR